MVNNASPHSDIPPRLIRRHQVEHMTGLSRSALYEKTNPRSPRYDPTFPKAVLISTRAVAWVESEIVTWAISRIAAAKQKAQHHAALGHD